MKTADDQFSLGRRVSVADGLNSLELPFRSRVQEARDWGSNGWSMFEDDSSRGSSFAGEFS